MHFPVRLAQSFLEAQTFDLPLHPLLPHTRCYRFGVLFRLSVYLSYYCFLLCVGLVALLQNLALALGLCGFANVPPIAWAKSISICFAFN
jgi:hypothetical protein